MRDKTQSHSNTQRLTDDIFEKMVIPAKVIRKFGNAPWPLMEHFQRKLKAVGDREVLLETLLNETPESASRPSK